MPPWPYTQRSQWECDFHTKFWPARFGSCSAGSAVRGKASVGVSGEGVCVRLPVCLLSQHMQSAMHSVLHKKVVFPEAIVKLSMQTSLPALCALATIQQTRDKQKSVCGGDGETCAASTIGSDHPNSHAPFKWIKCIPRWPHRQRKISLITAIKCLLLWLFLLRFREALRLQTACCLVGPIKALQRFSWQILPIDCQIYTRLEGVLYLHFQQTPFTLKKWQCHLSQTHNWFWHEMTQISFKVDRVEKESKYRKHWLKHIKHIHMLRCAHTVQKPKEQISRELSG